jgi:hypothetical protein
MSKTWRSILVAGAVCLGGFSAAWADPSAPAPTSRPAAAAPVLRPETQPADARAVDLGGARFKVLRYRLILRQDSKIIAENLRRWKLMTPEQRRTAIQRFRAYFIHIDEEELKELYRRQEEFRQLDRELQQRYRRYARQVHALVESLPAHQRSKLMAMKPDARKKELIQIIQKMKLKGQWPPKIEPEKEADGK